jgi:hypothetical protein
MNKVTVILLIIALLFTGYYAFYVGLIVLKAFIGLAVLAIFGLGIYIGRLTKKQ